MSRRCVSRWFSIGVAATSCLFSGVGLLAKDAAPAKKTGTTAGATKLSASKKSAGKSAGDKSAPLSKEELAAKLSGKITYTKHIAPILWENCAGCHRPGEVGPFSLLSYEDAAKRAEFIAELVTTRRMPPWKAEPSFYKFHDERRLTDRELKLIEFWAKDGAPQGDPKDLPKPPKFQDGWQLGEPDLVLKMDKAFTVPADGRDIYRCFVIPIPGDKDKYVSAVEFRPGNPKVVHHAIMFLDANGQGRLKDGKDGKPGFLTFGTPGILPTGGLGSWTPGAMPRHLPDGVVKYIRKGSDLVLQIHYHPSGKEEDDQSQVGVYFSKTQYKQIITGIAILQTKLTLPAGEKHCEVTAATEPLPADVELMAISPHMHNLGKEFEVIAKRPGKGKESQLISIKDWDFNWQGAYHYQRPVSLPKGTVIEVRAVYDNSADNPKNPFNPPQEVKWGEQTNDEMLLCGLQVVADKPSELRQIVAMKGNEMGAALEGGVPGQAEMIKRVQKEHEKSAERELASKGSDGKGMSIKERARAANAAKKEASKVAAEKKDAEPAATEVAKGAPAAANDSEELAELTPGGPKSKWKVTMVPVEGVQIPESGRQFASVYDTNQDGKLSRAEVDAIPDPLIKVTIIKSIVKILKDQGK